MAQINPHINFNGNAEEAFTFYRSVFGGEFSKIIRFGDMAGPDFPVPDHERNSILHIELPIGAVALMANDVPESMGRTNENEHRSKIFVRAESPDEAARLYAGLSAGGRIEIPLEAGAAGPVYGMFRDRYGIEWIISFEPS